MRFPEDQWGLVLGGSSGLGLASAHKLAQHGLNLVIVHRDRRGAMKRIEPEFETIRQSGVQLLTFNQNALERSSQDHILNAIRDKLQQKIRVFLHSIASGSLKVIAEPRTQDTTAYGPQILEEEDLGETIFNMGTSLLTWTQALCQAGLFTQDARIIGLTSEGSSVAWRGYAAISAAKSTLEAISRSMALELAPYGLRSNIIQAGITETPASSLIPGIEGMKAHARARNPFGRLTQPEDVANAVFLLCTDEARWINGTILRVDGGEAISGGAI